MSVPEETERFAARIGPRPDRILAEMEWRAARTGFPIVGPAVGGWLQQLAGLVGAERVFEFGSGFGYSAYWFVRALPAGGEVVLAELDAAELDDARRYFERGGYADRARFERGDAIGIAADCEGPFEAVLIDNEKRRYVEAFETIRAKVPIGGVVVADNVIEGPFTFGTLRGVLEGSRDEDGTDGETHTDAARGIEAYLDHVGSLEGFETTLLPLGEGLAVSRRRR